MQDIVQHVVYLHPITVTVGPRIQEPLRLLGQRENFSVELIVMIIAHILMVEDQQMSLRRDECLKVATNCPIMWDERGWDS